MKLTKKQLAAAPVCGSCYDYVDEPDCKIVERRRGWVHVGNNSVRCPGQEDDDTDDRAVPLAVWVKDSSGEAGDDGVIRPGGRVVYLTSVPEHPVDAVSIGEH